MTSRTQQSGKQGLWTLDEIKAGLDHFYKDYGRYPTALEIDSYPYLPSSRTLQRRFNGAVGTRKTLKVSGQHDFRSGKHSQERAKKINRRAHLTELEVYKTLVAHFGKEFVHREYFFTDDKRSRADFFVYDREDGFCVDVFYPSDRHNLIGCINSKLKKYRSEYMRQYPIIFVQMNSLIEQKELDSILKNKKNKLPTGQNLLSFETFKIFCRSRKALKVV